MTWRMELWVEGATDARTRSASGVSGDRKEPEKASGGALIPLLRKALLHSERWTPQTLDERLPEERVTAHPLKHKLGEVVSFGGGRRHRDLPTNYARKVRIAIDAQRRRDPSALILAVWDRDGRKDPLSERDALHEDFRSRGEKGAVIAICVEELEAWLLADSGAFRSCFRQGPKEGLPGEPETERNPKETLMRVLRDLNADTGDYPTLYAELARHIDIDTLVQRCPRGFGELRSALKELIEPCLAVEPPATF